jgi:D-3-phosphoglycerate dehydrogenase
VAEIARGFGMFVYAYDPFVTKEAMEKDRVIKINSAEELYFTCQYISLHIPANAETKNSINYNLLSKLPKGGTLVNTARKEVIDEESLKKIFAEREDFKYITDIVPSCHEELLKFENRYFATPKKQGAETSEANINAGIAAAKQIVNYLKFGDKTFQVNK